MNSSGSEFPDSGSLRKELQGPRPTPLKVRKDSHKIRKPPLAPQMQQQQQPQIRPPVIIYTVSPKVIHTNPSDFMNLVQRLTGSTSSSNEYNSNTTTASAASAISPAARFATIEKIKTPERRKQVIDQENLEPVELEKANFFPGILSPGPNSLPPVSPIFFSPPSDPNSIGFFHDLSPSSFSIPPNYFIPSPPTPYTDLFNNLFNL